MIAIVLGVVPTCDRVVEEKEGNKRTRKSPTKEGNAREESAWVDSRDEWCQEGIEEKEGVLRYRARAAALGRSMVHEGQNDEVWISQLDGLTVKMA